MEKITVRIGRAGPHSTTAKTLNRSNNQDNQWLAKTLEISGARANTLVQAICKDPSSSQYIEVVLTYAQLGRYTAARRVDDLVYYWKYPHVICLVEDEEPPVRDLPIELRPGRRK
jgi:hypothetical protein